MLQTVHSFSGLPAASKASNFIVLGCGRFSVCASKTTSTWIGCSVRTSVRSVQCPRPVAARLPNSVTRMRAGAAGSARTNRLAARWGPMLCVLEGPAPIA